MTSIPCSRCIETAQRPTAGVGRQGADPAEGGGRIPPSISHSLMGMSARPGSWALVGSSTLFLHVTSPRGTLGLCVSEPERARSGRLAAVAWATASQGNPCERSPPLVSTREGIFSAHRLDHGQRCRPRRCPVESPTHVLLFGRRGAKVPAVSPLGGRSLAGVLPCPAHPRIPAGGIQGTRTTLAPGRDPRPRTRLLRALGLT